MDSYRATNNADKVIEMGRKALSLDPDNPLVLVMLGNVLAENARDTDPDVNQEYTEAMKDAQHGLETMKTGLVVQPGTSPDTVAMMQQALTAMAHSALGWIELKRHNDAAAEQHLRQAAQLNVMQPDPMVYLRLAIALDHQSKYADALAAANKAIEISPNGNVADLARQEKDRLEKLTAKPAAPAPPATPATQPAPTSPAAQPSVTPPKG
jgi:tetratricopeptide (TPR) repeat protein